MENKARRKPDEPWWGEYLSYRDAQRYTRLSRSTLSRMLGRGDIRAVRAGSSVRIVRSSLDAYLEAHAWQSEEGGS